MGNSNKKGISLSGTYRFDLSLLLGLDSIVCTGLTSRVRGRRPPHLPLLILLLSLMLLLMLFPWLLRAPFHYRTASCGVGRRGRLLGYRHADSNRSGCFLFDRGISTLSIIIFGLCTLLALLFLLGLVLGLQVIKNTPAATVIIVIEGVGKFHYVKIIPQSQDVLVRHSKISKIILHGLQILHVLATSSCHGLLPRLTFLLAAAGQLLGKERRSVTRGRLLWLYGRLLHLRLALDTLWLLLMLKDTMRMLCLLVLVLDLPRRMHLLVWMLWKSLPLHNHHLLRHHLSSLLLQHGHSHSGIHGL